MSTATPVASPQYRWGLIMLSGAALVSITLGIRQVFGLFLIPISTELNSGVQIFSLAIAIQNLVWGASSPVFGAVADKYGALRVAAFGLLVFAAGLLSMALVVKRWYFQPALIVGTAAPASIAVGAVARAAPPAKRSLAMGLVTSFGSLVNLHGACHPDFHDRTWLAICLLRCRRCRHR